MIRHEKLLPRTNRILEIWQSFDGGGTRWDNFLGASVLGWRKQETKTMKGDQEKEASWGGFCIDRLIENNLTKSKLTLLHPLDTSVVIWQSYFLSAKELSFFASSEVKDFIKGWSKFWLNHRTIDYYVERDSWFGERAFEKNTTMKCGTVLESVSTSPEIFNLASCPLFRKMYLWVHQTSYVFPSSIFWKIWCLPLHDPGHDQAHSFLSSYL